MSDNNGQSSTISSYQQTIEGFIPDKWKEVTTIITAYRVINIDNQIVEFNDHVKDFKNIRVVWIHGNLSFRQYEDNWEYIEEKRSFQVTAKFLDVSKKGNWILFVQPENASEFEVSNELSSYCGIYISMNGLANAFEQVFQYRILPDGKTISSGKRVLNPGALKNVNISNSYLSIIHKMITTIDSFDELKANRIKLSLHWFEKSVRNPSMDSFINIWIAFEALTMKTSDIKDLKIKVGLIYGIDSSVAGRDFFINRLNGLRGKIVHEGFLISMHSLLSNYLSALYTDLLMHECQVPSLFLAGELLASKKDELTEILTFK